MGCGNKYERIAVKNDGLAQHMFKGTKQLSDKLQYEKLDLIGSDIEWCDLVC